METQLMVRTALVLLALTALGGLLMAGIRFSGKPRPPSSIAMLHGLLAGSGLTLLLYAAIVHGLPGMAWLGIVLLAGAALGGLVLNLAYHTKELPLPIWLVLAHAAIAVVGFVVLILGGWNVTAA
ncbi:hypothetical protein LZ009_07045 [Ramlibacter sp. XY19]|uniref:hypothetical protein n=1 Tax=Ramlibacter paludis TaxID=2908000 RepID=UPI0023DA8903|nr:hypothetical protein [Ramlibacter paludis]MCG2592537.1 hypothetical protein [Ramlibacter paludis]